MYSEKLILSILFLSVLSLSCSTTSYRDVYPILNDGRYDSEFPYRGCSAQLENISESVKMVSCIAYYKRIVFPFAAKIKYRDIGNIFFKEKAEKEIYFTRTASGSATIIYYDNNRIAFLTCAHVITFPDSIITYYRYDDKSMSDYIQSVTVKEKQVNYVAAIQGADNLEALAINNEYDLAILGQINLIRTHTSNINVFDYPIGKAKELEWGAFVYLFGYPAGYKVITKAIVSNPNRDKYGSFLTDAVFNRGFSGGIILAIRDGVPNFELVGMVKLVPARLFTYVTPLKEGELAEFDTEAPFKGELFIENKSEIIYGVAPAIPAEMIVEFVEKNIETLEDKGYFLQSFVKKRHAIERK